MTLVNVTIASNNIQTTLASIGDIVTVFFTSDQDITVSPVVTIAGKPATVSGEGKVWNAKYTLTADDVSGPVTFTIDIVDGTGAPVPQVTTITAGEGVTFKKVILSVSIIKKILVIAVAILTLAALFSIYTFTSTKNKQPSVTSEDQAKIEKKVLSDDMLAQKAFMEYSTSENQDAYIVSVNKTLTDNTFTPFTTNLLKLRKAIALSNLKGSTNQEAYVTEATAIFKDFILNQKNDAASVYLKDFSIVAGVKLHTQCCFVARLADKDFPSFETYKNMGYSDAIVNLLTLNDISKMVSKERDSDISNISNKFGIEIDLLMKNKDSLKKETYDAIYKELGENLAAYKTAKPILFTDPASTFLRPTTHYAVAYDVYYSHGATKLTEDINKKIDANYEQALAQINAAESLAKNKPLINEMKVYLLMGYINSLSDRYGSSIDKNKQGLLVHLILQSIGSSKETQTLFGNTFKQSVLSPNFKNSVAYNFFALYKTYPELDTYLKTLGIEKGGEK